MNPERVRLRLVPWRPPPSPDPEPDPDLEAAQKAAEQDPALRDWFQAHREFQQGIRDRLRSLPVPEDLPRRVLSAARHPRASSTPAVLRPRFTPFRLLGAAAALLLAFLLSGVLLRNRTESPGFAVFRDRMVRAAIREYRMDLETPDLSAIRGHLRTQQAPSDFELTPALAAATPVGGGVLSWQGRPVSMVCLRTPETGMLYLFISESEFADAPGRPELGHLSRLATASWTMGRRVYVLAAETTEEALRRFVPTSPTSRGEWHPTSPAWEGSVPTCRLSAYGHGRPAEEPVVVGAFVVGQFDR